jgi:signal transduction histidine kinase/ligand-binding sensor domain-containing protein
MMRKGWLVLAIVLTAAGTSLGQRASNWRVYKAADGMPESASVAVTVGSHGRVWATQWKAAAVTSLDGYSVQPIPMPAAGYARVYESPAGQLWTTDARGLEEYLDGVWTAHPVQLIADEERSNSLAPLHPIALCPFRQGQVIFLLPDRLMEVAIPKTGAPAITLLRSASDSRLERFLGMTAAKDGSLWISGARGVAHVPGPARMITPDTTWQEYVAPDTLQVQNLQEPFLDDQGGVTMVASGRQKAVVCFANGKWTRYSAGNLKIRFAWRSPDDRTWATTIDGLFQMQPGGSEFLEDEELPARQYLDVAVEPGGAFWLATSDGLFRYAPSLWRPPSELSDRASACHCIGEDDAGGIWFTSSNAVCVLDGEKLNEYPLFPDLALNPDSVLGFSPTGTGFILIDGADGIRQFRRSSGRLTTVTLPEGASSGTPIGSLKDGSLCIRAGQPDKPQVRPRLWSYDGNQFAEPPFPQPGPDLPGDILSLFTSRNGNVWLGTTRGIGWYHDGKWQMFNETNGLVPQGATRFAESNDGGIWCATPEILWEFNGRQWTAVQGNYEHINSLTASRDGGIWVGSNTGIHRFLRGAWVENSTEDGLPSRTILSVIEDHRGHIWADTSRGTSRYHPEADPDPPRSNVHFLGAAGVSEMPEGSPVSMSFGGQDKWKYTAGDRLLYSYRLDQMDWSPFIEANRIQLAEPSAGKHSFQVRAMDRNCNVDPNPLPFTFTLTVPWYRESRVVWTLAAGMGVALFFAGLAFNRHLRLVHSYAEIEKKVAERSRQLELAHQELLQGQKMTALGTLAAGIAHDFNNILSIIKGSAQIIEDNLDNPQKVATRLDRIKTVVEQGSGIVHAMLGFSRGSEGQALLCDLNATVEQTIRLLGDRFLRDVNVAFKPAAGLPRVAASQDFIQQILLNFIFNAAEAVADRREVVLSTGQTTQLPPGIALAPQAAPPYAFVAVIDHGTGIKSEVLPRIFEPFFTTKAMSARRGTGLGLSMVYQLAVRMDAGLAVASAEGRGSTFTLLLPIETRAPAPARAPAGPDVVQKVEMYGKGQDPDRRG